MKPLDRAADLQALRAAPALDLLVIGGGIAGAGVALEAARAGLRVALVEARDFASGTSSRSSKLVHGGLRYLAQGQIALTRESVREREALLRAAPGLVQPLGFLLPVRRGDHHGRRKLGLGLALYDRLAGQRTRAWFDAAALLERAPALNAVGLLGGWRYLDAQTDDARLVLRVLAEARQFGALTLNHVAAAALTRDAGGRVDGAQLHDAVGGQRFAVPARCVVNATGAWADALRAGLGRPQRLRPLRGSHLLFEAWRLPVAQALTLPHPDDGRPVYALPWEGSTLVGTTDLDHADDLNREPAITRAEFDYLLRAMQQTFPTLGLAEADVVSTWAGVRPVLDSGRGLAPSQEAREHLIACEDGLITVTGGKLTTFRSSAIAALRLAAASLPELHGRLHGRPHEAAPLLAAPRPDGLPALQDLSPGLRERWLARFGDAAPALRAAARPGELETIAHSGCAWAELRWACRAEAVVHLDDLLLRRSRLGLLLREGAAALLPRLQAIVQQELGWDAARWQEEQTRYRELIARCYGRPPREA